MSVSRDIDVLARTVYGEARSETWLCRIAVAHVVRNRWLSCLHYSGVTIAETALKPYQFSCWNNSRSNEKNHVAMLSATLEDRPFAECYHAALTVILGLEPDPTGGADYYCRSDHFPKWAEGKISVHSIGRHRFYRIDR